jgi:hypothetical protein
MRISKRAAIGIATLSTAAMAAAAATGTTSAGASTLAKVPTITAHVSSKSISLSSGSTFHAGRVIFRVVTGKGDHVLQIARLHSGYTLQQAFSDLNKSFGGNVAAVRRIDENITFRGGVEARPNHPGRFAVLLNAGRYLLLDQNSNALKMVTVVGKTPARARIPHGGTITAFSYGFGTSSNNNTIPASGWLRFNDQSDQPHFLEIQHVKASTTNRMVRKALTPTNQAQPGFMLKANTSTGVISPKRAQVFHYDLPAGKYLIACFWPDDDTGMPHAFMGMWKLIILK